MNDCDESCGWDTAAEDMQQLHREQRLARRAGGTLTSLHEIPAYFCDLCSLLLLRHRQQAGLEQRQGASLVQGLQQGAGSQRLHAQGARVCLLQHARHVHTTATARRVQLQALARCEGGEQPSETPCLFLS